MLPVSLLVLISLTALCIAILVIDILWTQHIANNININLTPHLSSLRLAVCALPILLFWLNQSANIALIIYFVENGYYHFFVVSLILFIIYRIASAIIAAINADFSARLFLVNFFCDCKLFRSLPCDYICQSHYYQVFLLYIQILFITFSQITFSLIVLLSSDLNLRVHDQFILLYCVAISSALVLFHVIRHQSRAPTLYTVYTILNIVAQIFILSLTYLQLTYIGFYVVVSLLFVMQCVYSVYFSSHYGDFISFSYDSLFPHIAKFLINLVCMILITIFAPHSHALFALMIACWILGVAAPILALCIVSIRGLECLYQDYRVCGRCMDKLFPLALNDSSRLEHRYFRGEPLNEAWPDSLLQIKLKSERKGEVRKFRLLLIGDGSSTAACKVYKQWTELHQDIDSQQNEQNLLCLVHGFVHEFEQSTSDEILIPHDISDCIVTFYGVYDGLLFGCYDGGITQFEYTAKQNRFHVTHVHNTSACHGRPDVDRKRYHRFDDCHTVIFCVSLLNYCEHHPYDESTNAMHEALNVFDEMVNHRAMRRIDFALLFVDYEEFAERIKSERLSMKECFPDYTGDDCNVDDSLGFIKDKFVDLPQDSRMRGLYGRRHGNRTYHFVLRQETNTFKRIVDDIQQITIMATLSYAGIL